MTYQRLTPLLLSLLVFALVTSGCQSERDQETSSADTPTETVAQEKTTMTWSYVGDTGPANWASLDEAYAACADSQQSPVDLAADDEAQGVNIELDYESAQGTLFDTGHGVQVNVEGGTMMIDGKAFALKQFHFHTPSEHTLDGQQYPAEAHLVHAADDGELATANTHQPYEFAVTYGVLRVGQPIEYDRFRPPFTTVTDAWAPEQLAWPAHRLVLDGGHRGPPVEAGPAETDFTPSPASPTDEPRLAVTGTNPVAGVPIEESTRGDPPQLRSLYQSLSAVSHLAYERDQHANKTPYQVDQLVVLQPPTRSSVVVSGTVERARPRS